MARCSLGQPGWRDDLRAGLAMSREVQGITRAAVTACGYAVALLNGAMSPDATSLADTADTLRVAERLGDNVSLAWARVSHGIMLARLDDQDPVGMDLLVKGRQQAWRNGDLLTVTMADVQIAECKACQADPDTAIEVARATLAHLFECGGVLFRGPATTVLVESLLGRGAAEDLHEAQAAIDRLAACTVEPGFLLYDLALLRSRALVARFRGDDHAFAQLEQRYREVTSSAGFDGLLLRG
jgi:adenylate cyclase